LRLVLPTMAYTKEKLITKLHKLIKMGINHSVQVGRVFASADEILAYTDAWTMDWLRRIVKRYAAQQRCCEMSQRLLAASVAWALAGEAAAGNEQVFRHIEYSTHPHRSMNDLVSPPLTDGSIMVQGRPLVFCEDDATTEHIMWDFYAVLIELLAKRHPIQPFFFDVADRMQWKAYEGEAEQQAQGLGEAQDLTGERRTDR